MSYTETRLYIKVWIARCDICGASAGEPADSKSKALDVAMKRWGFTKRWTQICCADEACRIAVQKEQKE